MSYKILLILLVFSLKGIAQHHHRHHTTQDSDRQHKPADSLHAGSAMSHAFSRNLPMSRNGSGTAWLPDSTPMYGYMLHAGKWMFMAHGNVFARYTNQDLFNRGSRGDDKFDAVNWFMLMGQRQVGRRGLFRFSTMLSLDILFGGNGYPLLFQPAVGRIQGALCAKGDPTRFTFYNIVANAKCEGIHQEAGIVPINRFLQV